MPAADAVVTLTASAAREISDRWGIEALVLPHPHVVDFVRMRQERGPRPATLRVGTHLAALQLPIEPVRFMEALASAVSDLDDAHLCVHVHETVLDPGSSSYGGLRLRDIERLVREVGGSLRVHRPFTDSQLWDHLLGLDVTVVPGLYGSHSVWPEACADLGTQSLLPAGTHAATQQPCLTYAADGNCAGLAESFGKALRTAQESSPWRVDPERRWTERVRRRGLRALYERLLTTGADSPASLPVVPESIVTTTSPPHT
jgi:hypothetical protein